MNREPEIWELLRRARDLEQEAEGLRRRAGKIVRRELSGVLRKEAGALAGPASTSAPTARAGARSGEEPTARKGR